MANPKAAFYWASSCGGCEIAVLELGTNLVDMSKKVDIVLWPVALDYKYSDVESMPDKSIDICFFNGAIQTSENEHMAKLLRDKSKILIAFGACANGGGIKLVEEILGYEEVIIVDSYAAGNGEVARIREFAPEEFKDTLHASSPHDTNFATALELYRGLELGRIPRRIRVITVSIHPTSTFGEGLTSPVQEAATELAESIIREIEETR